MIDEERILVLAPTGRDSFMALKVLTAAGLACQLLSSIDELCQELENGSGAILLTDEALSGAALSQLIAKLDRQESWSDIPLVVFPATGDNVAVLLEQLGTNANVTILERPVRIEILVNALKSALRARRRQYETRNLLQRLEHADRQKDLFLATLSHELRTPLTAILGWCRLVQKGDIPPEKMQFALEVINRNATAQSQLITDILSVSQIVAGTLRINKEPLDIAAVIHSAVESIRPAAATKGVSIDDSTAGLPVFVLGDGDRLQQVLSNLLSNSLKFSQSRGRIEVRLSAAGAQCTIEVCDSGKGISADFLPFVFDRFRQADNSFTRAQGGLGLGLAIGRHLVELHGGTIEARSDGEGKGSTFTVTLPLAIRGEPAHPPSPSETVIEPTLAGVRILAVDDDSDSLTLLGTILRDYGATVIAVNSAKDAIEVFKKEVPHVLVSDIGMPEQDGYDLLQRIRAISSGGEPIPAIALSGYASAKDREQALSSGYRAHLAKPFEPIELVRSIENLVKP
jgi:signal transduction histidine kinase/CheY-like chemotaxis protein